MPCMPSKSSEPEKRLLHIRDNIHLARKFIEGLDYEAFRDNHLVFYGVTRCLEIISEASRRLPNEMKAGTQISHGRKWLEQGIFIVTITRTCSSDSCGAPYIDALPPCWRLSNLSLHARAR